LEIRYFGAEDSDVGRQAPVEQLRLQAELDVIESFLPQQMSAEETTAAIEAIKAEVGATSVKDMGKVMAVLKERHGQVIDMSKASGLVKAALG